MHLLAAFLAYGDAPSSHIQLNVVLQYVQTDLPALLADAMEAAAIFIYLYATRRLGRRGRRWSPWSSACFIAGVACVWVAVGSGVASYDEKNVVIHVVQHVLLMMVAAPLIVLGKPITLATQAARRANQVRIVKVLHSRAVEALTFPVLTWFLYFGVMYAYFEDRGLYDYAINHVLFHDATHFIFLTIGLLYWQPIIGADPTRWKMPPGVRILITFIGMPFEVFLGISIYMSSQPIDPINSLENTRAAGQAFWILAMAATTACLAVMAVQWYRQLQRETPREDRQAQIQAEQSRQAAARLGVAPQREGWTIPAWRLAQIQAQQTRAARAVGKGPTAGVD